MQDLMVGVTVNVPLLPLDLRNVSARLARLANEIEGTAQTAPASEDAPAPKAAKPAKAAKAAPAPVEESPDFNLGDEVEAEEKKEATLDQVIDGFKAYAKRHSREKAGAVLKKFGVKSVHDLKTAQYADVLEMIG